MKRKNGTERLRRLRVSTGPNCWAAPKEAAQASNSEKNARGTSLKLPERETLAGTNYVHSLSAHKSLRGMMRMKSMKFSKDERCDKFAKSFYGTATIGERGQLVIPAEARAEMGFEPGDKVLIMKHPIHPGLMLFKIEAVREFVDDFNDSLAKIEHMHQEDSH